MRADRNKTPLSVVTGGCGFVGKHLVDVLLAQGHRVRVIDLMPSERLAPAAEFIRGSVQDAPVMRQALESSTYLFHLAANPFLWDRNKRTFRETHLDGIKALFGAAREAGTQRIVHTSTESILIGKRRRNGPIGEDADLTLDDMPGAYCKSKFLAEQYALQAARDSGLPVTVVNPTLPIGPGDDRVTPPSRMLLDFLNGRHRAFMDLPLNLIDVRSLALGHWLAAQHGRIGERYILGGENLHLSALLERLAAITGLSMPRTRVHPWLALGFAAVSEWVADMITKQPPVAPLSGVRLACASMPFRVDKARTELGLSAADTDTALTDAILWFRDQGMLTRSPEKLRDRKMSTSRYCNSKPSDGLLLTGVKT